MTTVRPPTLAQAVAEARHPRNHATAMLEPHRDELLQLRRAGESVESLAAGLCRFGIEVGRETLRLWLNHELGVSPPRERRRRQQRKAAPIVADVPAPAETVVDAVASDASGKTAENLVAAIPEIPVAARPPGLIRPGETPFEAFKRRTAEADAAKAAAVARSSTEGT